jgi:hypothetical protein
VSYEVTSPFGPQPVASWRCETCDCGSGEQFRDRPTGGTEFRDAAAEHLRLTGHAVSFYRGTREDLIPLRT